MNIALGAIKLIMMVWDFFTFPIYQFIYRPWVKQKEDKKIRSKVLHQYTTDSQMIFESPEKTKKIYDDFIKSKPSTMVDAFAWAVRAYSDSPLLGTREILREEDEVQSSGKMFRKYHLGDYRWVTYEKADATVSHVGRGLSHLGLNFGDNVAMFADTRAEWFLAAQACFRHGFPLVTLYTNLGLDAVAYGINQTGATVVFTSYELLPKFKTVLKSTPTVKHIVYFEHQVRHEGDLDGYGDVKILPFYEVVSQGRKLARCQTYGPTAPSEKDTAIIMYTSGSTGDPKGVILSHKNVLAAMTSVVLSLDIDDILKSDIRVVYIAFLPLAHVLELLVESSLIIYGSKIGYSSPNTLTDKSTMVKKGCKGDATVLQPNFMAGVPLIFDRLYKAVNDNIHRRGKAVGEIFEFALDYKLKAHKLCQPTPIMDRLIFRVLRSLLGGKLQVAMTGGAPLSPECHNFLRTAMGMTVIQGYGLTETTACCTIMELSESTSEGKVGPPNQGIQIKLINWEEGNYKVTDKPYPRGEIIVGGHSVAEGYYLMTEKTDEEFYSQYGRRWFRTGDIGQMETDGTLRIIDRKKDLVKLQFGEYISLGKVESVLKTCNVVDNICVYGDPTKSFCLALVTPDKAALKRMAENYGKEELNFKEMCCDKDITGAALRELSNHGKKMRLEKFEIPGALSLVSDDWVPESGMVTAAFKIKRKPIQQKYQADIDRIYNKQ